MQITPKELVELVIEYNAMLEESEALMTTVEMAEILECEVIG